MGAALTPALAADRLDAQHFCPFGIQDELHSSSRVELGKLDFLPIDQNAGIGGNGKGLVGESKSPLRGVNRLNYSPNLGRSHVDLENLFVLGIQEDRYIYWLRQLTQRNVAGHAADLKVNRHVLGKGDGPDLWIGLAAGQDLELVFLGMNADDDARDIGSGLTATAWSQPFGQAGPQRQRRFFIQAQKDLD